MTESRYELLRAYIGYYIDYLHSKYSNGGMTLRISDVSGLSMGDIMYYMNTMGLAPFDSRDATVVEINHPLELDEWIENKKKKYNG